MKKLSCHLTAPALVPVLAFLAIVACGCSSKDNSAGDSASSSDALTSDEAAEGASWDGDEEDYFSPDEEAEMSEEGPVDDDADAGDDDSSDDSSDDVQTASVRHDCDRQTGYNHGKVMSVCTTPIDGKDVEVSTAASYETMRAAAAKAGVGLIVVSGFRTMEKQRELYADYKNGTGNLAAPPGFSNHQSGHAVDLNTSAPGVMSWLVKHAATYGFRRTVPSENWHYEKW